MNNNNRWDRDKIKIIANSFNDDISYEKGWYRLIRNTHVSSALVMGLLIEVIFLSQDTPLLTKVIALIVALMQGMHMYSNATLTKLKTESTVAKILRQRHFALHLADQQDNDK